MAGFFVHMDNPSLVHNRKAGYAAESVEIIIPPMYESAFPFESGRALVSFHADIETDREYSW
ncbi:MAG: WG repeat-containing protein [Flavobacteriales bacterium]|nr:WG repeat-containing protein [Flavobacteriales bacterium]